MDNTDNYKTGTCTLLMFQKNPPLYQCSECYLYIIDTNVTHCPYCGKRIIHAHDNTTAN